VLQRPQSNEYNPYFAGYLAVEPKGGARTYRGYGARDELPSSCRGPWRPNAAAVIR
jgi:hypothetical protein